MSSWHYCLFGRALFVKSQREILYFTLYYIFGVSVWLTLVQWSDLLLWLLTTRNDLRSAIKKLKSLGNGFSVIPLGKDRFLVQSVPSELTMDHTTVIQLAEVSQLLLHRSVACGTNVWWSVDVVTLSLFYLRTLFVEHMLRYRIAVEQRPEMGGRARQTNSCKSPNLVHWLDHSAVLSVCIYRCGFNDDFMICLELPGIWRTGVGGQSS